jgi:ferredoxin
LKIFYFTGTGNSLYVAKRIGGERYSIPQMTRGDKKEFSDETIGFVFPCYFIGIPRIVREFIKSSIFNGKYFFAIMTYGNMAASGLKEMEKTGREAGVRFNYMNEIMMTDNYLPIFDMKDELKTENQKKIEENLESMIFDIQNRKEAVCRKGMASDVITELAKYLMAGKHRDGRDKSFMVQENCNGCKTCAKVCPVGNIRIETHPVYLHHCEGCFACIHHCPQNAIHLNSEKSDARFINQNIKLAEIMMANNQNAA